MDLSGLKKGALHRDLGIKQGEKIPAKKLKIKASDSPLERKRKIFAENARKRHHGGNKLVKHMIKK